MFTGANAIDSFSSLPTHGRRARHSPHASAGGGIPPAASSISLVHMENDIAMFNIGSTTAHNIAPAASQPKLDGKSIAILSDLLSADPIRPSTDLLSFLPPQSALVGHTGGGWLYDLHDECRSRIKVLIDLESAALKAGERTRKAAEQAEAKLRMRSPVRRINANGTNANSVKSSAPSTDRRTSVFGDSGQASTRDSFDGDDTSRINTARARAAIAATPTNAANRQKSLLPVSQFKPATPPPILLPEPLRHTRAQLIHDLTLFNELVDSSAAIEAATAKNERRFRRALIAKQSAYLNQRLLAQKVAAIAARDQQRGTTQWKAMESEARALNRAAERAAESQARRFLIGMSVAARCGDDLREKKLGVEYLAAKRLARESAKNRFVLYTSDTTLPPQKHQVRVEKYHEKQRIAAGAGMVGAGVEPLAQEPTPALLAELDYLNAHLPPHAPLSKNALADAATHAALAGTVGGLRPREPLFDPTPQRHEWDNEFSSDSVLVRDDAQRATSPGRSNKRTASYTAGGVAHGASTGVGVGVGVGSPSRASLLSSLGVATGIDSAAPLKTSSNPQIIPNLRAPLTKYERMHLSLLKETRATSPSRLPKSPPGKIRFGLPDAIDDSPPATPTKRTLTPAHAPSQSAPPKNGSIGSGLTPAGLLRLLDSSDLGGPKDFAMRRLDEMIRQGKVTKEDLNRHAHLQAAGNNHPATPAMGSGSATWSTGGANTSSTPQPLAEKISYVRAGALSSLSAAGGSVASWVNRTSPLHPAGPKSSPALSVEKAVECLAHSFSADELIATSATKLMRAVNQHPELQITKPDSQVDDEKEKEKAPLEPVLTMKVTPPKLTLEAEPESQSPRLKTKLLTLVNRYIDIDDATCGGVSDAASLCGGSSSSLSSSDLSSLSNLALATWAIQEFDRERDQPLLTIPIKHGFTRTETPKERATRLKKKVQDLERDLRREGEIRSKRAREKQLLVEMEQPGYHASPASTLHTHVGVSMSMRSNGDLDDLDSGSTASLTPSIRSPSSIAHRNNTDAGATVDADGDGDDLSGLSHPHHRVARSLSPSELCDLADQSVDHLPGHSELEHAGLQLISQDGNDPRTGGALKRKDKKGGPTAAGKTRSPPAGVARRLLPSLTPSQVRTASPHRSLSHSYSAPGLLGARSLAFEEFVSVAGPKPSHAATEHERAKRIVEHKSILSAQPATATPNNATRASTASKTASPANRTSRAVRLSPVRRTTTSAATQPTADARDVTRAKIFLSSGNAVRKRPPTGSGAYTAPTFDFTPTFAADGSFSPGFDATRYARARRAALRRQKVASMVGLTPELRAKIVAQLEEEDELEMALVVGTTEEKEHIADAYRTAAEGEIGEDEIDGQTEFSYIGDDDELDGMSAYISKHPARKAAGSTRPKPTECDPSFRLMIEHHGLPSAHMLDDMMTTTFDIPASLDTLALPDDDSDRVSIAGSLTPSSSAMASPVYTRRPRSSLVGVTFDPTTFDTYDQDVKAGTGVIAQVYPHNQQLQTSNVNSHSGPTQTELTKKTEEARLRSLVSQAQKAKKLAAVAARRRLDHDRDLLLLSDDATTAGLSSDPLTSSTLKDLRRAQVESKMGFGTVVVGPTPTTHAKLNALVPMPNSVSLPNTSNGAGHPNTVIPFASPEWSARTVARRSVLTEHDLAAATPSYALTNWFAKHGKLSYGSTGTASDFRLSQKYHECFQALDQSHGGEVMPDEILAALKKTHGLHLDSSELHVLLDRLGLAHRTSAGSSSSAAAAALTSNGRSGAIGHHTFVRALSAAHEWEVLLDIWRERKQHETQTKPKKTDQQAHDSPDGTPPAQPHPSHPSSHSSAILPFLLWIPAFQRLQMLEAAMAFRLDSPSVPVVGAGGIREELLQKQKDAATNARFEKLLREMNMPSGSSLNELWRATLKQVRKELKEAAGVQNKNTQRLLTSALDEDDFFEEEDESDDDEAIFQESTEAADLERDYLRAVAGDHGSDLIRKAHAANRRAASIVATTATQAAHPAASASSSSPNSPGPSTGRPTGLRIDPDAESTEHASQSDLISPGTSSLLNPFSAKNIEPVTLVGALSKIRFQSAANEHAYTVQAGMRAQARLAAEARQAEIERQEEERFADARRAAEAESDADGDFDDDPAGGESLARRSSLTLTPPPAHVGQTLSAIPRHLSILLTPTTNTRLASLVRPASAAAHPHYPNPPDSSPDTSPDEPTHPIYQFSPVKNRRSTLMDLASHSSSAHTIVAARAEFEFEVSVILTYIGPKEIQQTDATTESEHTRTQSINTDTGDDHAVDVRPSGAFVPPASSSVRLALPAVSPVE